MPTLFEYGSLRVRPSAVCIDLVIGFHDAVPVRRVRGQPDVGREIVDKVHCRVLKFANVNVVDLRIEHE